MAKINTLMDSIQKWMKLSKEAKELKDKEAEARRELASELSTEIGTKRGLEGSLNWKVENGLNYNIDQGELNKMIEQGAIPKEELDCIKWKAELKMKEYKALVKPTKKDKDGNWIPKVLALNECITITPAMPTIEIKSTQER